MDDNQICPTPSSPSTTPATAPSGVATTPLPGTSAASPPGTSVTPPPDMAASSPPDASTQRSQSKTDNEVIREILVSSQGTWFDNLRQGKEIPYRDVRMAMMALLCIIAGFTQDPIQIDRIFRNSRLVPPWWDEPVIINGVKGIVSNAVYWGTRAAVTYGITVPTAYGPQRLADYYPDVNPRYTADDIGSSNLYCDIYRGSLKYVEERKSWYGFGGQIWSKSNGAAMECSKILVARLEEYVHRVEAVNEGAFPVEKSDKKKKAAINAQYIKHAKSTKSRRARETMLKDAQSGYGMAESANNFDTDPYLLCCENGTLDLRNGSFRPHSPQDMITKMANVVYNPQARSPLWLQHLNTVMDGDQERALFLQKAVGASLIGTNDYCYIVILYGPRTRNGKSVTMDTIKKMMGTYAAVAKPETFAQKRSADGSGHSEDLVQLAGKRFVSVPEIEKKMTLSASLVKRVTGEKEIAARAIFEHQIEFTPQFTLFFNTNFLPRLNDLTPFDSGRIKVIPFTHYFGERERNPHMVDELTTPENLSGILNWALEGLQRLKSEGFTPPQSVLEATEAYHNESDQVGSFIAENMQQDGGYTLTREAFRMYCAWCEGARLHSGREQDFKLEMEKHGIPAVRKRIDGKQVTAYMGWRIVA